MGDGVEAIGIMGEREYDETLAPSTPLVEDPWKVRDWCHYARKQAPTRSSPRVTMTDSIDADSLPKSTLTVEGYKSSAGWSTSCQSPIMALERTRTMSMVGRRPRIVGWRLPGGGGRASVVGCGSDDSRMNGDRPRIPMSRIVYDRSKMRHDQHLDQTDGDSDVKLRRESSDKKRSTRVTWVNSHWPNMDESRVKRIEMRPPSLDGRGSVWIFLAKFDNCALHNRWTESEQLHYLTNCLEDPAAQILWDLRSGIISLAIFTKNTGVSVW